MNSLMNTQTHYFSKSWIIKTLSLLTRISRKEGAFCVTSREKLAILAKDLQYLNRFFFPRKVRTFKLVLTRLLACIYIYTNSFSSQNSPFKN